MQRRRQFILYVLLIFAVTGPACGLTSNLGVRLAGGKEPTAARPRHLAVLPPAPSNPVQAQATLPAFVSPWPTPPDLTSLPPGEQVPPATTFPAPVDTPFIAEPAPPLGSEVSQVPTATPFLPRPRPRATATPDSLLAQLSELLNPFAEPTATPTRPLRLAALPTIPPTPTATPTFTPSPIPTETPIPTDTSLPVPADTPTLAPIDNPILTPLDTPNLAPADTPNLAPADTPVPEPVDIPAPEPPPAAPVESAFTSPLPASESTFISPLAVPESTSTEAVSAAITESTSGYDFLLGEFYNSPTNNSFIVIYVAIVDANEIPIGDMKVVGTRLDHHLTYESPLSTWHFEGYNAPGEVIKSGNVKFEPPGGIETTSWVLHLEDAHSNRVSEDVPFDTNQNDKQWYFIKFKRKF